MAATHYTQWIYNQIVGTDYATGKRFEIRITCGVNNYDYNIDFPDDAIILDSACFKILDFGKLSMRRFDENAAMELVNRTFTIKDSWIFSGLVNGVNVGTQDLGAENTSLIPFIFNDLTKIYYVHLTQLNMDGTPVTDGIYFSGEIDPTLITTEDVVMLKPMTAFQQSLGKKKIIAISGSALLKNHTVEEIVSGSRTNGVPDGLVPGLLQSDMHPSSGRPMYDGFLLTPNSSGANFAELGYGGLTFPPDAAISDTGIHFALSHFKNYLDFFGNGVNYYGVNKGIQHVSYASVINKMSQIMGLATFSASDADSVFTEYFPIYAGDLTQYDKYSLFTLNPPGNELDSICLNYNVKFGVNPYSWAFSKQGLEMKSFPLVGNLIAGIVDVSISPVKITTTTDHNLKTGEFLVFSNASNRGVGTDPGFFGGLITVVSPDTFTIDLSDNTQPYWTSVYYINFGDNNFYDIQTPATYERSLSFSDLIKRFCFDRGYLLDWEIIQSGTDKGKLKIKLVNPLKDTGDIPLLWQDPLKKALLSGSTNTEITLSKHHIKIQYDWDSQEIYFPDDKGEGIEIILDQSAKRWGFLPGLNTGGYAQSDFINNPSRDLLSQEGGEDPFTLDSDWWIKGTRNVITATIVQTDIVNNYWINHSFGLTGTNDWNAFFGTSYEQYQGGLIIDATNFNPDYFNRTISKGEFWANVFLLNTTIKKLSFRSCVDDSGLIKNIKPRLSWTWQDDDGITRKKLLHAVDIEEIKGICDAEFITSPNDYKILTPYKHLIKNPKAGTGGITTTGITTSNGNGNSSTGMFLRRTPSNFDNVDRPSTDSTVALFLRDFSDTHSANKLIVDNKDGTITYGGIHGFGSSLALGSMFFANTKNGIEFLPYGIGAGETGEARWCELAASGTNYVGFKAPDSLAGNNIYTLPNAFPTSNYYALIATTGGIMSWGNVTGALTGNNGILITGSSGTPPGAVVGISTNGIALDRLAQIADQTILGNNSGGTGNVIALTAAQASVVILPSQASNSGKFLTTNGTVASWATVSAGVSSITGTAHQIIASASTGAITLSTPQDIDTTSAVQFARLGLGIAPDSTIPLFVVRGSIANNILDGFVLENNVAATGSSNSQQQWSPAIDFVAGGWASGGGGSSQAVQWKVYVLPIVGTTNPTGELRFESSINGSTPSPAMRLTSAGDVIGSNIGSGVVTGNSGKLSSSPLSSGSILFASGASAINGNGSNFTFIAGSGLFVKQPTSGNTIEKIQSNTFTATTQGNEISVTGGTTTLLHSFSTTNDTEILCVYRITWRQTNGVNTGKGGGDIVQAWYHNIAGTLAAVGGDIHNGMDDSNVGGSPTIATNVNVTAIEIKVTVPAAHNYNVSCFATFDERT